ncbi:MAG TPA: TadG family pilus assembly protein [Tepidisphaeraceae bacterium]|nr:TadG family pilus assembly protein [Tepidisphaeraceae bacterium]
MSVVFAFASLALDYGRVQLARTELRTATDVAARWGVRWVNGGLAKALGRANEAAGGNYVNGVKAAFNASQIEVGYWNSSARTFTPVLRPHNAVRLVTSVTVPLVFGGIIGMPTCTVRASTVARCLPIGIAGLNSIDFKNNTFIGSYDSSVTVTPTQVTAKNNGVLLSNGTIGGKNNGQMHGDIYVGPGGSVETGWAITGAVGNLSSAVPTPADPAWSPVGNPGGAGAACTGGSLVGGTYWLTSVNLSSNLTFTGPATLYVNGDININGRSITAYQGIPSNLKIYQIGTNRTFSCGNGSSVKACISAPGSDFSSANGFDFFGVCVFRTITCQNNARFFFDEDAGTVEALAIVQ